MRKFAKHNENYIPNCMFGAEKGVKTLGESCIRTVARAAGLEPTTYGLEDRCSIH